MSPDESPEVRLVRLETRVDILEKGQGKLEEKIDQLTEKLNGFMLKTALSTAGLSGLIQLGITYYGGK